MQGDKGGNSIGHVEKNKFLILFQDLRFYFDKIPAYVRVCA